MLNFHFRHYLLPVLASWLLTKSTMCLGRKFCNLHGPVHISLLSEKDTAVRTLNLVLQDSETDLKLFCSQKEQSWLLH